jgi:PAS domain S-box-containing protein
MDRFFLDMEPHILVIIRDITERKKAQETLAEESEFFNAILDSARSVVVVTDGDDRIIFFNRMAEHSTGVSREAAKGRDWAETFVPEGMREMARKGLAGKGGQGEMMLPFRSTSGAMSLLWIATTHERHGSPVRIMIGVDVTEMESQRQRIQELNGNLRLLNRILRHDITNDMMVAMGSLQLYEKRKEERLLTQCMAALEKSVDFINDMADLEAVLASHEGKRIDVGRVARKLAAKYEGQGASLIVRGEATVLGDDTFSSTLDNLIRNALMHGQADRIEIVIEEDDSGAKVFVKDNGKGIPDAIKANVFEEGFKFGETGHTGLGLYIVRKSMERHGGSVRVEDNHPKGTTFVLSFPRHPAAKKGAVS